MAFGPVAVGAEFQPEHSIIPPATSDSLGVVKPGRGLTVSADGTLEVTKENLDMVLGFSLAEKLKRLERMMEMDGKLVYTGTGAAGRTAKALTVPDMVDYIVVRMLCPMDSGGSSSSSAATAVAAEYGSTRIARGGAAVAMVGGGSRYDMRGGVACEGAAPVRVSFAADGTVNIGVASTSLAASEDNAYPFNVEGYQYV